jgi:hypothetical protein
VWLLEAAVREITLAAVEEYRLEKPAGLVTARFTAVLDRMSGTKLMEGLEEALLVGLQWLKPLLQQVSYPLSVHNQLVKFCIDNQIYSSL